MKKYMTDEELYDDLHDTERREEIRSAVAKTPAEAAEHRRKAASARKFRSFLQKMDNKDYRRVSGGAIVAKPTKKDRDDQRKRIKAYLGRSGM